MGAVVLGSLPSVLRAAGVRIELWPGYETRSRSTGGFEALLGIGHHHDAIPATVSEDARSRSGWDRESNTNRPVGNVRIKRDGTWVIGSLMATNTQGRGVDLHMSKGVIPENRANLYMFSIEPSNDGIGQPWPKVQTDSLLTGTAAICNAYALQPSDNLAHFETAPGRKADPAGPSEFTVGQNRMWPMDVFRARLAVRMNQLQSQGDEMTQQQYAALDAKLEALLAHARTQAFRQNWVNNERLPLITSRLAEIHAEVAALVEAGATETPVEP